MKQYLDNLQYILDHGVKTKDRTGVGTISIFGVQTRYNLRESFPIITTKKIFMKGVIHELLWMLKGDANIKYLVDNGVHIWDAWADKDGNLGPVYGNQWRAWQTFEPDLQDWRAKGGHGCVGEPIDQIAQVIENIKTNPNSRRHVVNAWNVADIPNMRLPPCHMIFQFYVANGELSCMLTQRSADYVLGAPFNISSYALLTHMVAQACNLGVGDFIHSIGNCHIYNNHIDQVKKQLGRQIYELPKLVLNLDIKNIDDFKYEDIKIEGYRCHPTIKAPVAV